MRDKLQLMLS